MSDITFHTLSQDKHEILLHSKLVNVKRFKIQLIAVFTIMRPVRYLVKKNSEEVFRTEVVDAAIRRYNSFIEYI